MGLGQRGWIRRSLLVIEAGLAAAGVVIVASHLIAAVWPAFDTIGQLSEPWLCLCAAALLAALWSRRRGAAAVLALVCAGLCLAVWPQVSTGSPGRPQGVPLRIYFNNIWTDNVDGAAVARSIVSSDADVVALVQVTDKNRAFVERALARYPYRVWAQRVTNGVGRTLVASRFPLSGDEPNCPKWELPPGFEMVVQAPTPVRLIVVHLPRPWPFLLDQVEEYGRLARQVNVGGAADQTVVVGDFNATLSSTVQRRLARDTGLRPLPAVLGDWPTWLPAPFRLAIENAFAGDGLSLRGRRLAPLSGSDHQPLVFEVFHAAAAARGRLPATAGRPACFP